MNLTIRGRKPSRCPQHDYNQSGGYFLTVCVQDRHRVLSRVNGPTVQLSRTGKIVEDVLLAMPVHYSGVDVDCHIVMPDHLHWIFMLSDPPLFNPAAEPRKLDLIQVVHRFKSLATKRHAEAIGSEVTIPLFQRSFYDRYIRTDEELNAIRTYIRNNAWAEYLASIGCRD